ncbi:hypothetical protein [Flavobacterium sp.]|uniref:hypothetical protein n=1 Tax=Flavobacterium sp. TaxID=239 RepID=UPI003D142A75
MVKKFFVVIFIFFMSNSYAQVNHVQSSIYNVGAGGLLSGIGAVINKSPDMPFGKTFVKGFCKGAIGGAVIYGSKNLTKLITDKNELGYSWLAKFTNSVGVSMVENGATNKKLLQQINIHFGFNRFEFVNENKVKVKYKIMPVSLILTGYIALNNKFEPIKTLQVGEFIFSSNTLVNSSASLGYNIGVNTIIRTDSLNDNIVYNHEIVHVYQLNDFNSVNTLFKIPLGNKNSNFSKFYNKFFYTDIGSYAMTFGLYSLQNSNGYDLNFFENEARLFSE